jgi:hypothetical protein
MKGKVFTVQIEFGYRKSISFAKVPYHGIISQVTQGFVLFQHVSYLSRKIENSKKSKSWPTTTTKVIGVVVQVDEKSFESMLESLSEQ